MKFTTIFTINFYSTTVAQVFSNISGLLSSPWLRSIKLDKIPWESLYNHPFLAKMPLRNLYVPWRLFHHFDLFKKPFKKGRSIMQHYVRWQNLFFLTHIRLRCHLSQLKKNLPSYHKRKCTHKIREMASPQKY